MKGNRLLSAIGGIDDRYITEAAPKETKKPPSVLWKAALAVASFAILLSASIRIPQPDPDEKLPMLSIRSGLDDGYGFEGHFVHRVEELTNNNPWYAEVELQTLPVYQNAVYPHVKDGFVIDPDTAGMKETLYKTARSLDMDTTAEIVENKVDGCTEVYSYCMENERYRVEVNAWLMVNVSFKQGRFPDGLTLRSDATYEQLEATASYLQEAYHGLLNMKNPTVDIYEGDYSVYGDRRLQLSFYDTAEDVTESMVNYAFHRIRFYGNEDGSLSQASFYGGTRDAVVGDYPIITVDEAEKLLIEGRYLTSVPDAFPGAEAIGKVELVYRVDSREEFFIPYYRFYVKLDESHDIEELNLITYGTYYVPAVSGEYIENVSRWDGSFQ
ncbi:MAG: hypothetical protein J6K62_03680 [Clostridia bacterium]|nr:hypothetical protein [Clostridia bacterium]